MFLSRLLGDILSFGQYVVQYWSETKKKKTILEQRNQIIYVELERNFNGLKQSHYREAY